MNLTLAEVCQILGIDQPCTDSEISGYSIDSRTIEPGELFFAIRGPRFDGHDFAAAALARGAAAAIVERGNGLKVPSVPNALARLATEYRRRWDGRVVAVTGSAGKTSTKDMIAAVLASRFRVHKSAANLNNQYGLPLQVLKLNKEHQAAVFELGMSHAGEIAALARIAQPDTGVITCVAPVHLEFFENIEAIARAKHELIVALPKDGLAVLNADDPLVSPMGIGFDGWKVSFGIQRRADFRATHIVDQGAGGVRFCVDWEGEPVEVSLPVMGRHNVLNALAAMAVGTTFGVYPHQAKEALAAFRPPKMRGETLTIRGATVINDAYNSNPRALSYMLQVLARTPAEGRRIAVLGEMLELGPASAGLHREAGRQAAGAVDYLVGVRGDARHMVEAAMEAGLNGGHSAFFENAAEAGDYLASLARPGDVILLKGSRGVRLELALERLAAAGQSPHVAPGG